MKKFFSNLLTYLNKIEGKMNSEARFSASEINEILSSAKKENIPFLNTLMSINKLSVFDVSLILSRSNLTLDKIEVIKINDRVLPIDVENKEVRIDLGKLAEKDKKLANQSSELNYLTNKVIPKLKKENSELKSLKYLRNSPIIIGTA